MGVMPTASARRRMESPSRPSLSKRARAALKMRSRVLVICLSGYTVYTSRASVKRGAKTGLPEDLSGRQDFAEEKPRQHYQQDGDQHQADMQEPETGVGHGA